MPRRLLLPLALTLALAAPAQGGGLDLPKDKGLHLLAGAAIAVPVYLAARAEGRRYPELWAAGAAFLAGLLKELADRREPGNRFDPADLGYTLAGGLFVTLVIRW